MESLKTIKSNRVQVFLNVQHSLLECQIKLLQEKFGSNWEIQPIPMTGWSLEDVKRVVQFMHDKVAIFASPVPILIKWLTEKNGGENVFVFYNEERNKKQVGNVVKYVIAEEGWQLL